MLGWCMEQGFDLSLIETMPPSALPPPDAPDAPKAPDHPNKEDK